MPPSSRSQGFVGRHLFTVSQSVSRCDHALVWSSSFSTAHGLGEIGVGHATTLPIGSPFARRTQLKLAPTWRRDWASTGGRSAADAASRVGIPFAVFGGRGPVISKRVKGNSDRGQARSAKHRHRVSWLAWPREQTELGLRNTSERSLTSWGPHCVTAPLTGSPTSAWRPKRSVRRTTGANRGISSSMNSMGFDTACLTRNGCKRRRTYR